MTATFYVGDAVTVMNTLPEKSVDLILTSPPFLALRSYLPQDHPDKALEGGSQATPGEYVDWLLDVVEACARVLAPHGSLCFELGDTYAGNSAWATADPLIPIDGGTSRSIGARVMGTGALEIKTGTGWPLAKSLSLIPESFRWAMVYGHNPHTGRRTEPWRLRNVIRWVRPNPPVGALGDKFRPATSELMVFCKAKDRFFDLDAVREAPLHGWSSRLANGETGRLGTKGANTDRADEGRGNFDTHVAGAPPLDWWNIPLLKGDEETRYGKKERLSGPGSTESGRVRGPKTGGALEDHRDQLGEYEANPHGVPPLDWWQIPPGGYPGAHYAVWPPELLVKPIKAMCPESVCRVCGEARRRIVSVQQATELPDGTIELRKGDSWAARSGADNTARPSYDQGHVRIAETLGFSDCSHDDYRPGLVLDPFAGTGTTLAVATGHGRDAIGIDLDERNYELALDRVGPLILQRADGTAPRP